MRHALDCWKLFVSKIWRLFMKKRWIALISAAVILVQGALALVTSATGVLFIVSVINAVN